jgi:hypothetical protein
MKESAVPNQGVELTAKEEEELYILLKPRELDLDEPLQGLLQRIEKSLFERLTIEEIEGLTGRFRQDR